MNCTSVLHLVIATATVIRDSIAGEHYDCKSSQETAQEHKSSTNYITTHFPCAIEAFGSPRMFPDDFSSCVTFAKVKLKKNIYPILTSIWKRYMLNLNPLSLCLSLPLSYTISALSLKY